MMNQFRVYTWKGGRNIDMYIKETRQWITVSKLSA